MTRVALYCRVSTQMERQMNSLSAQMDFQKQDILDRPDWEYAGTYTDVGSGRSINSRPGFRRLMADCEAGKIDLIYTKSISRLGRNCVDFLVVLRRLKELGVDVYFQNEGLFLSNESSELLLSLHAALAQAESEDKSGSIRWGIRKSIKNPDSPAFSRPCFGYEYVDTYTDIGSGRSINSRPGFKHLMADCEAGRIDLIYTKSISRIGRNCVDFLIVLRRLKELGVDVYFQNEDIFLSNESSELILSLHAALAQAESEDKSTSIRWGIRKSIKNPDSPAFSRPCFGYDRDGGKKLVVNEKEAEIVRMIFGWYEQGWSIVRIKKELEASRIPSPTGKRRWANATITDILSNEKYAGDSVYGKTTISEYPSMRRVRNNPDQVPRSENHHPAIIDKACFERVQEMRRLRTNVVFDEQGNKARKNTHYSMKRSSDVINEQIGSEEA